MATEEEAFIAGFKHGYTNGRAAEIAHSGIEGNARAAYQVWLKDPGNIQRGPLGAVIPAEGVKTTEKK